MTERSWHTLSRFGVAWRVLVSGMLVGSLMVLCFTTTALMSGSRASLIEVPLGAILFALLPVALALLAAAIGGARMRRFSPLLQAVIFGLLAAMLGLVLVVGEHVIRVLRVPCDEDTYCWGLMESTVLYVYLVAVPLLFVSAASYGLAVRLARGGRLMRVFWPLFAVVIVVTTTLWVLAALGIFTAYRVPEPQGGIGHSGETLPYGMCADYDRFGQPITVECSP